MTALLYNKTIKCEKVKVAVATECKMQVQECSMAH